MQIDDRRPLSVTGSPLPVAIEPVQPPVQPTAATGHASTDGVDTNGQAATPDETKPASELDLVVDELRTTVRAAGADFPTINNGRSYAILPDGFMVPVSAAILRARDYGIKQPRDFVVGEICIELARARLGYSRTNYAIRENAGLRVVIELLETVHAARAASARYPLLTESIQSHVNTILYSMADKMKATGAPESIRTFVLTCLARAMRDDGKAPQRAKLDDHVMKVIDEAVRLFTELTTPPSVEEQQRLDNDSNGASGELSKKRVDRARAELFPYFGELIMLSMPKAAEAAVEKPKSLLSAEEAIARNKERAAAREHTVSKDTSSVDQDAKADVDRLIAGIKRFGLPSTWANPERPTPSEIQQAVRHLIEHGSFKEPANLDRLIELTLRNASKQSFKRATFAVNAGSNGAPPWSVSHLRQLAGPNLLDLFEKPIEAVTIEPVDEPRRTGGLGRLFEDRSKNNEARDWVTNNESRVSELHGMVKLAGDLSRHDGVTADLARRLQSVQRDVLASFDECSRIATSLAKKHSFPESRRFSEARARVETLLRTHDAIIATIKSFAVETGAMRRLLRLGTGQTGIDASSLVAGVDKVREAQQPAREYVKSICERYAAETKALVKVLGPRLDWFDTAVNNASSSRQSDPLLPIFDGAWIGTVAAELRRAELAADRILKFVSKLPEDLHETVSVEIGSEEAFKSAMVESAATRLVERLAGRSATDASHAFDIAAVQSRTLPALAAHPRLHYLCVDGDVLRDSAEDLIEIDRFGDLALRNADGSPGYAIDAERTSELRDTQAARGDYNFWCRTFDLEAPSALFMSELMGWRTYHASALERIVAACEERIDDFDRTLSDAAQLGNGVHPVADIEDQELQARFMGIAQATRRLGITDRALTELTPFLDASKQPVAVLLHAIAGLPRAKDGDAAIALVTPWLALADRRLREAARQCIAKIRDIDVPGLLIEQLDDESNAVARLLAVHDTTNIAKADWALAPLVNLASNHDPVVRAFASYAIANIAAKADEIVANNAGTALIGLLDHDDTHVVQFAVDGLSALADKGNAFTSKLAVDWVLQNNPNDPQIASLLEGIGSSPKLFHAVALEARGAHATVLENARSAGISAPRRVVIKKAEARKATQRDLAAVTLSAARGVTEDRSVETISDRMKLALRLATKFNRWVGGVRPELKPAVERLDLPDGIVDDAVYELNGKQPRGYLSEHPELVSELLSAPGFSATEVSILETGCIPPSLAELAQHPMALDGSWRNEALESAIGDVDKFASLLRLKLGLSYDLPSIVGETIATILDEKTPSAIAAIAYDALSNVLGCDIPLLNPKLSNDERKQAVIDARPLDPTVDGLLERAVVDRLAVIDATSGEVSLLVDYLASGRPEVAERRLSNALDRATSEPQAKLLLDAARARTKNRRRSNETEATPWLVSLLLASPRATVDQVIAVRDTREIARQTSDAASLDRAAERVAMLATMALDVRENMPADELAALLTILTDSEDDRCRVSKIDGLKELIRNTKIKWTTERMTALRHGLLVVQANHRYGDMGATLEESIRFGGRVFAASPNIANINLGKLYESLARCSSMAARQQYGDAIIKMYRTLEARGETLSVTFIEQLGLWLAAADNTRGGSFAEADRKRENILNNMLDLLPLDDAAMTQLVTSCAGMSAQRTNDILRACKEHKRLAVLTPADVEKIAAKGATVEETSSLFKSLMGAAVSLTMWKPSESSSYTDPLSTRYNDSREIEAAKRNLRRTIGDIFNELAAPRGVSTPVSTVIDDSVGVFALGKWARDESTARNVSPTVNGGYEQGQISKLLSATDIASHLASAEAIRLAARDKMLAGKHPVEQMSALMLENSRAVAMALDSMFARTTETRWELSDRGPRIHTQQFVKANIQRIAHKQAVERAEAAGEPPPGGFVTPPYFLTPVLEQSNDRVIDVFFGLILDNSSSTSAEQRLGYFKQLTVLLLNAFGMTKNVRIHSAVTNFNNQGHLIIAPAQHHDMKTMIQALGHLNPTGGTNAVDGLDKSAKAAALRKYDVIIHGMVTDGQPNEVPATVATIETLRALPQKQTVIGFGVGPDTDFMKQVFGYDERGRPQFVAESDPAMLAPQIYRHLKDNVFNDLIR